MPIQPFSLTGWIVLAIFLAGMLLIILETRLGMDKFKPALLMMAAYLVIGAHDALVGNPPQALAQLAASQQANKVELFSLIAFMAFMWMIVELLGERGVFAALNNALTRRGLGARGMFWATGALSALLSPFLNNITTALIFGKSITTLSDHPPYRHAALCNIILASNSGVWFLGTATSLMVVLAGRISIAGLLLLIPASVIGWLASAAVLHVLYLRDLPADTVHAAADGPALKPGAWGQIMVSIIAVFGAVLANLYLHVDIENALGAGLGLVALYAWHLQRRGEDVALLEQLQKVEWNTLLFYIGIITGVAALDHAGWLSYISRLFEILSPTVVNVILGLLSGILDNIPVEAAAIMAHPHMGLDQWALNAMMVGIGGSLTVIGSAAGVMAMSLEKSYTFAAHLKYWPALLVNFLVSLGAWYLQFHLLHPIG